MSTRVLPTLPGDFATRAGTPYDRQVVYVLEHTDERAVGLLLDEEFRATLRGMQDYLAEASLQSDELPEHVASLPVTVVTWGPGQLDRELQIRRLAQWPRRVRARVR